MAEGTDRGQGRSVGLAEVVPGDLDWGVLNTSFCTNFLLVGALVGASTIVDGFILHY